MTATDRCVCGHHWAEHNAAGCYARQDIDHWCNCPAPGDPTEFKPPAHGLNSGATNTSSLQNARPASAPTVEQIRAWLVADRAGWWKLPNYLIADVLAAVAALSDPEGE